MGQQRETRVVASWQRWSKDGGREIRCREMRRSRRMDSAGGGWKRMAEAEVAAKEKNESWLQFVMAEEDHGCNLLPPGCRKLEKERSRVDGNRIDFRERGSSKLEPAGNL
ncbi:hypothetical protein AMTR_s00056p00167260 [Amborella trichopoda]|uniref:Uncharacterized protein n=1 Tax=Amborella trichopoda TaxID=13333 RepID=U5D1C2_AMBTC|nr:hypothetical protein AMTR_s00056p00167260 [Amborella trichopoda]